MPNGRARQRNTSHANRQRQIQRSQVVDATMINPIVISDTDIIVEAEEYVDTQELKDTIVSISQDIVSKKNYIKSMEKKLKKLKDDITRTENDLQHFIEDMISKGFIEAEKLTKNNTNKQNQLSIQIVPFEINLLTGKPDSTAQTTSAETIRRYIKFLEGIIVTSNNGLEIMTICGGFYGFDKNPEKCKDLFTHIISKKKD
jgi:hypothetical protein